MLRTRVAPLRSRLPRRNTIDVLEQASVSRFADSFILARRGRRHGAIYLLGYYFEMAVKSIFFRSFDYGPAEWIRRDDMHAAAQLASGLGIREPHEGYHNPLFWAAASVRVREMLERPITAALAQELLSRAQRVSENWTVEMRYAADVTVADDWGDMHQDALWMRANFDVLAATETSISMQEKQNAI